MSSYDPFNDPRQMEELRRWMRRGQRPALLGLVGLFVIIAAISSYYQVEAEEVGVVLRFGKHEETSEPGPHLKLPFGIDQVIKVPVRLQLKQEFGFRTVRSGVRSEFQRSASELSQGEMLTGDTNVATIEWVVQYRIDDPEKYLFHFREIEGTLALMAEATMRTIVGDHSLDELITGGREAIALEAKNALMELNSRYDTGLSIEQLKLRSANVPDPVKPALREVEEAKQERERAINDAWSEYNKVIPEAKGKAKQAIQTARGYAVARINRAEGDAERFKALYAQYRKAPEVTRTRLYLEAMTEVLPKAKRKIIVDAKTQGLVPLLNLQDGSK